MNLTEAHSIECPHCRKKFSRVKHGTPSGYTYGCRCESCTKAHAEHIKKYRKAKVTTNGDKYE